MLKNTYFAVLCFFCWTLPKLITNQQLGEFLHASQFWLTKKNQILNPCASWPFDPLSPFNPSVGLPFWHPNGRCLPRAEFGDHQATKRQGAGRCWRCSQAPGKVKIYLDDLLESSHQSFREDLIWSCVWHQPEFLCKRILLTMKKTWKFNYFSYLLYAYTV